MAMTPDNFSNSASDMNPETALKVKNLSEKYRMAFRVGGREQIREFWALKNISLSIQKGEILGIIGENGSGKTTLLKVLAGLLEPDGGTVEKQGTLSALIDIGAGLDQEFSGRENIFNALSLTEPDKTKHKARAEEIIAFADLGQFIDASVKHYSTGMQLRLGFSILVHVSPDILVVDEVISVGDNEFQNKCQQKLADFVQKGRTVILVSHDIARLVPICTRMILLKGGQIIADGNTQKVLDCYDQTSGSRESVAVCQEGDLRVVFNSGRVFIRWKDQTLTPFGAYSWASEFERFRENSRALIWKASVPEPGKILAQGTSPTSGQNQTVKISVNKDGRFNLDITTSVNAERSGALRKIERRCQLAPKSFARWFISGKEDALFGSAPKDMIDRALSDTATDTRRPYLAVGPKETDDGLFLLFNSHGENGALDYEVMASEFDNLAMRAFVRGLNTDKNTYEHKETVQIFNNKAALLEEIESLSAGTVLNINNSVLSAHSSHLSLEHNGEELFREQGLIVSFFVPENKRSYFSFEAKSTSIAANKPGQIRKKLVWDGLANISVELIFSLKDTGYTLDIEINNPQKKAIKDITAKFLFAARIEKISFCGQTKTTAAPKKADLVPVLFSDCYGPGFEINLVKNIFFSAQTQDKDLLWYFNAVREMNKTTPAADCVAVANATSRDATISRSFDFSLNNESKEHKPSEKLHTQIQNSNLKLDFSSGTAELFYKNTKISSGFGLYTSALIQDTASSARWADSRHGRWEVNEITGTKLSVSGHWPWAEMRQHWCFEITDAQTIRWALDIHIEKDSPAVCAMQAGLMLSEHFTTTIGDSKPAVRLVHMDENLSWFELGTGKKIGFEKRKKAFFGSRPAMPKIEFLMNPDSGCAFNGKIQKVKGLFSSKILVFETEQTNALSSSSLNGCIKVTS